MRTTLTLFLLFTIFSVADDILLDAAFRCWNAETDGVVGDIGALSSVTDDSDPGYTLV